ncbi:toxin-antitoxin system, antitoxin component, Xre family protein [Candidatus Desantisbacteria bacterium CG_4_9_14_3_um_filter_40_11]|uniref:Toxin-antitoxin system, antitoxin component, Xre family protein n=3 Tax=unclassified Candidatus Desantisiibacteriota TaxID=3106372 RepID=A0A2M7JE53_9BACT|nr:MAG: toxin-antitoxin system, antitoxin component, Xre family protein [Candidatus Desantisbacteria bacterium CG23_combo_of_CG06-09_8_20_14_all_40_23]PIX17687.1 MAG: toxin-antitoxin system, antitoxin component, Xre family protein [Candidatus Desantisbacteria bacterium CG_4_8_14_3_um_filter_40_12]PJB30532.1 MAG: toxin-antitoxin system, antitoxin component, Xre family protein [Candidatus Desantisbacteria bacterium CG_4_9_14_3_um_filter_40_11]
MSKSITFDEKLLVEEIKQLPTEKVKEVFDFVEFLRNREEDIREITKLSEPVFNRIWDNAEDAVYDNL